MKYVIISFNGLKVRAMFDDVVDHWRIADAIRKSSALAEMVEDSVSAALCERVGEGVEVFGHSESCMTVAKPEDADELDRFLMTVDQLGERPNNGVFASLTPHQPVKVLEAGR